MLTFCSLCGVLIPVQLSSPRDALSWLAEVRLTDTTSSIHDPFVTGVGWLKPHNEVFAPSQYTPNYWCYVLHDVCWKLLIARIDPEAHFCPRTVATHLFALFYNTPTNDCILAPGHDYGHAARFQEAATTGYFTRVNASEHSFITGDPREPFHFGEESLKVAGPPKPSLRLPTANDGKLDTFGILSYEITMLVLAFLPSTDVCNLRLASRCLSSCTSPDLLPQQFWSSRFDPDMELGFVFVRGFCPAPTGRVDWRALFFKAKEALRSDLFPGFLNRRRIWSILEGWREPLALRLANKYSRAENPYNEEPLAIPDGARTSPEIICSEASFAPGDMQMANAPTRKELTLHSRLFERESLIICPHGHFTEECRLRASFVSMQSRLYLSGLRYHLGGSEDGSSWSRAGFINPNREQEVCFGLYDSLEWLDITVSSTGILGLSFGANGPRGRSSRTLGDMKVYTQEDGVGRLRLSQDKTYLGFVLGLDACKVISVSLIEMLELRNDNQTRLERFLSRDVKPLHIWNPSHPITPPLWNPPVKDSSKQEFKLCYNMDFGGPEGCLLRSLTRLVFYMGGFPAVFLGIAFVYSNGYILSYGRKVYRRSIERTTKIQCVQQNFPIDGPNGEKITKVVTSYSPEGDTIQQITIYTKAERSQTLCLYGNNSRGNCQELIQVFEAKPTQAFTSFFAMAKSTVGYFRALSASCLVDRSQQLAKSPSFSPTTIYGLPITDEILASVHQVIKYPRGFVLNNADIIGIKNIRVSVTAGSRPPYPRHITGLLLEYRDSKVPVVLGQWIEELDNMYIAPEDRLTELTIWYNSTRHGWQTEFGHIKILKLSTACGQSKKFLGELSGDEILLEFRESPYRTIRNIFWVCNHEWDHLGVLYKPRQSRRSCSLSAGSYDSNLHLRQEVFIQELLKDGQPNPAVAIEVSYKFATSEPSGLTLIYASGDVRTIGTRGLWPYSMPLGAGEKLTRMEIGVTPGTKSPIGKIQFIVFLTNLNRTLEFSVRQDPEITRGKHPRKIFILDPSAGQEPATPRTSSLRKFPKDASAFVGFWAVLAKRDKTLRFDKLGPIFETKKGIKTVV
ncbi:hypothetical protein F5Y19DRAFT_491590 [Xylariaceae sp. FL1651]|nr:hypothetical protein F5Y19DRAFT_491590 [Xylariaceae sp. FL1651]